LFIVLAVSLGLSWVLALTQTTTFGNFILKEAKPGESKDPYDTKLYHKFEGVLGRLIKRRWITITSVIATLFLSLFIMSIMPQNFFPIMNKPYFRADLIFPEGYSIYDVEKNVKLIEDYLSKNENIKSYSFTLGGSPVRYYLASSSVGPKPNFANVLIETKKAEDAQAEEGKFYDYMVANYPDILTRSALFALSPVPDAAIEIGFIGDNVDTLVALTEQVKEIARQYDQVMEVRDSWGNKVPVWKPMYSQEKGLRLGITRQQVAYSLRSATNGVPLGEYREGDVFMPILMKDADRDSMNLNDIRTLPVYSAKGRSVKVEQVIDDFSLDYEYNVVRRYNRQPYMMMQCEPKRGANTMAAFSHLWTEAQKQIQVPEGYKMTYFGEQSEQDKGNKAIAANIPLMFGLIYVTLLFLFPKYYRKPVLIMAMLPLIFIGVVLGLLVFGKSLDFFAMLGLLGLIGMNIKNAIVLVDEIGLQMDSGLAPVNAVIEATKTRIVPVTMASGTTILGMLPLLGDAMFAGMAATIMGGLFVSTILTIFVLPVTYCIFFKIKSE
ncbi:efflux RND transporter permease subunit, partial [Parabacteroides goldsteinii]|uniref:efflux RND transporter permease subunit n=1 Tax=Parabacteroides goldsteinii TaxID=328812 RepID=UPI0025A395CA